MNKEIRPILLVEDSGADAEMTIDALREANVANVIVHVEDGVEAMEYLPCTGTHATRAGGAIRRWSCSISRCRAWTASRFCSACAPTSG